MNRKQRRASKSQVPTAVRGSPEAVQKLADEAVAFHQAGRLLEAEKLYRQLLALRPNSADTHNNLGKVLKDQNRLSEAVPQYLRAAELRPDYAEAHNNLGNVLRKLERLDMALASCRRALELMPQSAEIYNNVGLILADMGRFPEAIEHYERAVSLKPDFAEAHNNLGNLLEESGRLDDAVASFDRALALKPDYAEAHFNRARSKSFRAGDDVSALETLAAGADTMPADRAAFIHFALAKAYEDMKNYPGAFAQMFKGNARKRLQMDYNETDMFRFLLRVAQTFDAAIFQRNAGAGNPSPVPIFVVGMPRSGSTLIEQILSSHPQVYGAGELTNMDNLAHDPANAYPEGITRMDAAALNRLGQAYLDGLPKLPEGKTRMTDKLPGNFMHIGLIRLILPNAKIIHTLRDPVDTCVSCYSKLFTSGQKFTFDLAELGRYYRGYTALMMHWHSVLTPGVLLDVSYEDVVDDLEGQARRMIEFCGLPWDESCIDFQKNKREVRTASVLQVRKPIYRSSVQRWRNYEPYLAPLLRELGGLVPPARPDGGQGTSA